MLSEVSEIPGRATHVRVPCHVPFGSRLLTKYSTVLIIDPLETLPEGAVRKVALSQDGTKEDFMEHAICDHSYCPAIAPLSRLDDSFNVMNQGKSNRILQLRE